MCARLIRSPRTNRCTKLSLFFFCFALFFIYFFIFLTHARSVRLRESELKGGGTYDLAPKSLSRRRGDARNKRRGCSRYLIGRALRRHVCADIFSFRSVRNCGRCASTSRPRDRSFTVRRESSCSGLRGRGDDRKNKKKENTLPGYRKFRRNFAPCGSP